MSKHNNKKKCWLVLHIERPAGRLFSPSALNCNNCIDAVRVFTARFSLHNNEHVPRNNWRKSEITDKYSAAATLVLSTIPALAGRKLTGFLHHNQIFKVITEEIDYDVKYLMMKQKGSRLPAHLIRHVDRVAVNRPSNLTLN